MKTYRCDICRKEVDYEHMLRMFPMYDPATDTYEMRDHCPMCLKRALAMFTAIAMTQYPLLDFNEDSTLADIIHELRDKNSFLTLDTQKRIADRDADFKVVFTSNPANFLKREDE